ncbi:hypothetical protein [uncultured Corynebacterium sp.]|uniref:hypothetical protein n=1 Tax=uncultured Corynebacterium sp. TaxID=159447 RepID=UPI0025997489|nr:hypothetical protein [uncultured Corynebacterium sp.]
MGPGAILAVILIVIAAVAVYVGRGGSVPGFSGGSSGGSREFFGGEKTVVKAIVGSEKKPFFEDKEVQKALASHGYAVEVKTAGSRRMATDVNLDSFDMAFPSSAPAAEKIAEKMSGAERYDVFYTPMAIATFDNILQALERENVARQQGTTWQVDMAALATMQHDNVRWRDFAENDYPSPRTVQMSTTDIRSSNSAAMYLSLMSWITNEGRIVSDNGQVNAVLPELTPLFTGQGYTESSSAGPFSDYLSQGVGSKPMVMVYESQFLGEDGAQNSRLKPEMCLAYPSPTILSTHVALGFNDNGAVVARLLAEDPELQKLAAKHGYRSSQSEAMEEFQTQLKTGQEVSTDFVDSIDPPSFDILEQLIEGVSRGYQGPPRPETEEG